MHTGVCYFPEHWPRDRWETDIAAMADAGLEYVRLAEFSWAVLEPERGEFAFEWLDEAVELITEQGMQAILCTPTATPPKWLVDEHPDILQQERDGTVREFGSRRHYCFNSDRYRAETERVVTRMAERYADHPGVAGWQTDNEFGCHRTIRCYCEDCAAAFRDWLRDKYADAATLNEAWGTTFWSQRHASIESVDPPGHTVAEHHPARLLDYYRFSSDSAVSYNAFQAELLRDVNEEWSITHNFMGHFPTLDAYDASETLDFVSWDSYPTGFVQDRRSGDATMDELRAGDPDQVGLNHDIYRSAREKPFWVMEQQPGDVNWPPDCPQPGEGAMRLWAHHAAAHGGDSVLYFRWRRCLEGQEQYHAGLRKQDGSPDRGYHDAVEAGGEFAELGTFENVETPVALVHDYDSCWALDEQPHAEAFEYWDLVGTFYGALRRRGVQVDVVPPDRSFDSYDAVVVPSLYILPESTATALASFVDSGGQLLLGPRTGSKDAFNKLRPTAKPGPLASVVGATVDQHESFPARLDIGLEELETDDAYSGRIWAEWLDPADATPLAVYDMDGITDGRVAVTANEYGDGSALYSGVWPERGLADRLVEELLSRADVSMAEPLPDGVRIGTRDGATWLCNFTSESYHVETPAGTTWLVGGQQLGAFDVAVADCGYDEITFGESS